MSRRPIATVTVLKRPDLHPEAVRIEISCPAGRTDITQIPAPAGPRLPVPALVTAVTFRHEESCSACDTSAAHARGAVELRAETERMYAAIRERRIRYYAHGRRN